MLKRGDRAPDFNLPGLNDAPVSFASITANGPALLVFFKISCPTCQYTLPFLERLQGQNVLLISQDSAEDTREFHDAFRISLPTALDLKRDRYPASSAYGLEYVPSLFLVEPDGTIALAEDGFSRTALEQTGARFGVPVFRADEKTPAFRPG